MKKSDKYRFRKTYKRIISFTTAIVICFGNLPISEINSGIKKVSSFIHSLTAQAFNIEESEKIYISSPAELVSYSEKYNTENGHENDTIIISFSTESSNDPLTGFQKIGTVAAPFNGRIEVDSGTTFKLPTTMFSYITDDVAIVDLDGNTTELVMARTTAIPDQPLFAENVIHARTGNDIVEWKFRYARFYDNENGFYVSDFAGYIGRLDSGANIKVSSIVHENTNGNDVSNMIASGDIGFVCCTMDENSTLEIGTINIGTDNTGTDNYSLSSTSSGNAGGLVGSMGDGSKLILGSNLSNPQHSSQSITAKSGYAGGIVGYCNGGVIKYDNSSAYTVSQVINGSNGAGCIAGYYNTASTATLPQGYNKYADPTSNVSISDTCYVDGNGNCGAYYGELHNDGTMSFSVPAISITHNAGSAASFGGLFGKYSAESLSNSLTISTTGTVSPTRTTSAVVADYGGLIGKIDGTAYVNINGATTNSSNAASSGSFGGLIGSATEAFVELTGTNTISYTSPSTTNTFGGVVGDLSNGVLQLNGSTNLSGTPAVSSAAATSGQVVGKRDYGLVFASSGWTLTRSSSSQKLDDVGSWGEIVRFGTIIQGDVLTIDTTNHYVTLKSAVTEMSNTTDFVKTALNIQLNNGQSTGVLRCSGSNSTTLLGSNLSLKNSSVEIDLSGTGITGLTRDGTSNCTTYTKEFDGKGGKIKLATGEAYFANNKTEGNGKIYRHTYNGLFAKTNGATIKNLNISAESKINVNALRSMYIGNVVGQATGGLALNNVNICYDSTTNKRATINCDGSGAYIGGFVGDLTAAGTVNITSCTYNGEITGSAVSSKIGGIIGDISSSNTFNITIGSSVVCGVISTFGTTNEVGGTIGVIESTGAPLTYKSVNRKLKLNDLSISGLNMSIKGNSGGLLGYTWYETDVEFKESGSAGVTVSNSATITANSAASLSGLVHTATGYWKVNAGGINLSSMNISATSATDFGLLINNGHAGSSVIYLELAPSAVSVTKTNVGLTLGSVTVFDELVAHTIPSGGDITSNGNGIVSIGTPNHALLTMTNGGTPDTYQHKTAFLDSNATLRDNPNTRYYYNLDVYRTNPSAGAQQLLIWSVRQYAHDTIKDYFNFTGSTISGSMDMTGYSYYPVDLTTGSLSLTADVHLYNIEFDSTENKSGNDNRLSNEGSQHYMMHNSLFRNINGSLTFNGSLNGTVRKVGDYCGALVMGKVYSDASASEASVTISSLVLSGIKIKDAAGPLLINKAGSNTTLNISNISNDNSSYTSIGAGALSYIATSLLGDIGSSTDTQLKLTFSGIKLDGRNASGVTNLGNLTSVYNSSGCLFSNAILVNSFAYKSDSGSQGVYNYTYDDDWGSGNRNVTYGAEVEISVENADKEKWYNGEWSTPKYTRPDNSSDVGAAYSLFDDYFMRYVGTPYSASGTNHELRVNVESASFGGCGTYNDPYLITEGGQLDTIAAIIAGKSGDDTLTNGIAVPDPVTDSAISETWWEDKTRHHVYTNFKYSSTTDRTSNTWSDGTNTINDDTMAQYLAGAYYKIAPDLVNDIVLSASFKGLSANVDSKYAFRGVFDGSGKKIINPSSNPFIVSSNGCVVYNLTLDVQPTSAKVLTQNSIAGFSAGTDGCESYGAVIGKIFGGDNIIDNVSVKYHNDKPVINKGSASKAYVVPIGGYVGVVVNGGLIFREMNGLNQNDQAGITSAQLTGFDTGVGNTPNDPTASDNTKWLYINPIVGRVLNGYVITESDTYKPFENGKRKYTDSSTDYQKADGSFGHADSGENVNEAVLGVTMHNGTKNYSIADIAITDNASVATPSFVMDDITDGTDITLKSAQALYIMSLITESGLGKSTNGHYNNGGELKPYDTYMSTHVAGYHYVGRSDILTAKPVSIISNPTNDAQLASNDYYTASEGDKYSGTDNDYKVPYLIKTYTPVVGSGASAYYPAFDIGGGIGTDSAATTTLTPVFYDLILDGTNETFYLPDSYRGLGSLMFGYTTNSDIDDFKQNIVFLSSFDGADKTVSMNMNMLVYGAENYATFSNGVKGNYKLGFGLINCLQSRGTSDTSTFGNLTLKGKVKYELIDNATGNHGDYIDDYIGKSNPAVAAFIGVPVPEKKDSPTSYDLFIEDVDLGSIELSGMSFAGGYVGALNMAGTLHFTGCGAGDLVVFGGGAAGGLLGYMRNNDAKVRADFEGSTLGIKSIVSASTITSFGDKCEPGAGGLIGFRRTGINNVNGNENITISNVIICNGDSAVTGGTIGKENGIASAGGIIGNGDQASVMNINNVVVKNLNIYGTNAGGIAGLLEGTNSKATIQNTSVINEEGFSCIIKSTSGTGTSGGFIGNNSAPLGTEITDSSVEGYTISGVTDIGGFIGMNNIGSGTNLVMKNIEVSNAALKSNSNGGGLVGNMANGALLGYNILINNTAMSRNSGSGNVNTWGYIAGTNNTKTIKIAGFSRQGTISTEKLIGTKVIDAYDRYGTGGYVIFADYNGTATGANPNEKFANMQASGENVVTGRAVDSDISVLDYNIIAQHDSDGNVTVVSSSETLNESLSGNGITPPDMRVGIGETYIASSGTRTAVIPEITYHQVTSLADLTKDNNGFYLRSETMRNFKNTSTCAHNYYLRSSFGSTHSANATYLDLSNAHDDYESSDVAIWYITKDDNVSGDYKYKIGTIVTVNGVNKTQYLTFDSSKASKVALSDEGSYFNIVYLATVTNNYSTSTFGTEYTNLFKFETKYGNNVYRLQFSGNNAGYMLSTDNQINSGSVGASNNNNFLNSVLTVYYATRESGFKVNEFAEGNINYTPDSASIGMTGSGTSITDATALAGYQNDYESVLNEYANETGVTVDDSYEVWTIRRTVVKTNYEFTNASPFVTTNPRFDVTKSGETPLQWLTGDGVSGSNYYNSAAYSIISTDSNKKYQNTGLDSAEISILGTRLMNNMTTIKGASTADPSGYGGEDFPVLVINELTTANATVNNYLKLLTNTSYNFKNGYSNNGSDSAVYNVEVSKWLYNSTSGKFELQSGEAALKYNSDGFRITTADIDNDKWQISLIDVQFYDPTGTNKIAYHLYVPVVVKKMLHYSVQLRAASTTSYNLSDYPRSCQNLIENFGNPVTIKLTYTYKQDAQSWADAINSGENVFRNYDKILDIKAYGFKQSGDTYVYKFPEDAKFVLLDPNNNRDAYYYGNFSSGEGGVLTNGEIRETGTMTYNLDIGQITGNNLVKLNDLMDITAEESVSGNLVECGIDDPDLVCVARDGKAVTNAETHETEYVDLPLRYKKSTDGDGTTYYAVSVELKSHQSSSGYLQENYYLSIFTKEDKNKTDSDIYHYEFESYGSTFGVVEYPSAKVDTNEVPHLFLGNLYENKISIDEKNSVRKMDATNNYLEAELTAKVGFTNEAVERHIINYIRNDKVKIYQTFMVSLNRLNGDGNERGILIDPINIAPYDYTVRSREPDDYNLSYKKHKGYIELPNECDIKSALISGAENSTTVNGQMDNSIEIKETVKLTYAAGSLPEQFPKSTEDSTTVGTIMIGYSNISSTKDGGAASRASKNTDGRANPLLYYIENDTSVSFSYNAIGNNDFNGDGTADFDVDGNGNFGQLGVDGYELDENQEEFVQIKTAGLYDAHEYSQNSEANFVKISIKLSKKSNYNTSLPIGTYLNDFKVLDNGGDVIEQNDDDPETEGVNESNNVIVTTDSEDPNVYVYIVPKAMVESSENIYSIPIHFRAWSGNNSHFESINGLTIDEEDENSATYDMEYSNYKVQLKVGLLKTNNPSETPLKNSEKTDHIIYTNARLYSEVIS